MIMYSTQQENMSHHQETDPEITEWADRGTRMVIISMWNMFKNMETLKRPKQNFQI